MKKLFSLSTLTLLAALLSAGVSGVFSVFGMMTIFSAQPEIGIATGVVIELAKLMSVSWLYRNWKPRTWFREIGLILTLVAMIVTSMGVFGQLSKAHTGEDNHVDNSSAKVLLIDQRIERLKSKNADSQKMLNQLDEQVQKLINFDKISSKGGAKEVRAAQKEERDSLEKDIDENQDKIEKLEEEKFGYSQVIRDTNAELGPLKIMADLFYDNPEEHTGTIVKLAISLIVLILDPMAIYLLMCYNHTVMRRKEEEIEVPSPKVEEKIEEVLPVVVEVVKEEPIIEDEPKQEEEKILETEIELEILPLEEEDPVESEIFPIFEEEEIEVEEILNEPILEIEYEEGTTQEEEETPKPETSVLNVTQQIRFYDLDKASIKSIMEQCGISDAEIVKHKFLKFGKDNFYYVVSYKEKEGVYPSVIIGLKIKYDGYEGISTVARKYTWPEKSSERNTFTTEGEAIEFINAFNLPEQKDN